MGTCKTTFYIMYQYDLFYIFSYEICLLKIII